MTDYTFTLDYNVTGPERKRLVKAISDFLQSDSKYLGAPSFAYQVDYMTIDRNGIVSFDSRADSEEIEGLIETLVEQGFVSVSSNLGLPEDEIAEEQAEVETPSMETEVVETTITEPETTEATETTDATPQTDIVPQDEAEKLTVQVSYEAVNMGNLTRLLEAKGDLIKKALGLEDLPLAMHSDSVEFPWFSDQPDAETASARSRLISALCDMSVKQKRITATAKEVDNEKYAFRCFLLRLGFIGDEFKAERKILLRNLSGSSAFKSGQRNAVSEEVPA